MSFASPTIRSSRNSTLAPVPQAAVIRVQAPRLHIEQGEHVAADALPPLRLYPPLGLRVFQVDTRVDRRVGRGDGLHQLQLLREFVHYRPFLSGIRVRSASPFTPGHARKRKRLPSASRGGYECSADSQGGRLG